MLMLYCNCGFDSLQVDTQMEYHTPLCLFKLTLVKTIVNAWNLVDFHTIDSQEFVEKDCKLQEYMRTIVEKIVLLPLPKIVQKDLKALVRPIGLQILHWIEYHECFFNKTGYSAKDFVPRLTWTHQGVINEPVTAEELIKSGILQLPDQFQLACIYCREVLIKTLWNQLKDNEGSVLEAKLEELPILVRFWYHQLTGDLNHVPVLNAQEHLRHHQFQHHPDRYGFHLAIKTKNDTAVRWFWNNIEIGLSPEQREEFLVKGVVFLVKQRPNLMHNPPLNFSNEHCAQILLFLLTRMSAGQIRKLGEKLSSIGGSAELLKYMLDWPHQHCLVPLARCLGESLSPGDYTKVLLKIIDKIENLHETDCDYRAIFVDFWSRNGTLNGQIDHTHIAQLLVRLINNGNPSTRYTENIKAMISDVNVGEKQKLLKEVVSLQKVCFALVKRGLWSMYEMLLRSSLRPENDLNEQKLEIFALVGLNICKDLIVREKNWTLVHQFVKWSKLSEEMTTRLMQDLESYEANYVKEKRIGKCRKRNAVNNNRLLAKKQSR